MVRCSGSGRSAARRLWETKPHDGQKRDVEHDKSTDRQWPARWTPWLRSPSASAMAARAHHPGMVRDRRATPPRTSPGRSPADDPQHRDRGDVGREVRRHCEHQAGRQEGVGRPAEQPLSGERRPGRASKLIRAGIAAAQHDHAAGRDEHHEGDEADGEGHPLLGEREVRLDEEGVGEQAPEAAEVARSEHEVGILGTRPIAPRVPLLQQRPSRREHRERQADHHHQRPQQPQGRGLVTLGDACPATPAAAPAAAPASTAKCTHGCTRKGSRVVVRWL